MAGYTCQPPQSKDVITVTPALMPKKRHLRTLTVLLSMIFGLQSVALSPAHATCVSVSDLASLPAADGVYETCGGDDLAYKIPINGNVIFGGVTYSTIYATTNSTITFGDPDGTYDTFPSTPSISLDAFDWVQRGFFNTNGNQEFVTDNIGIITWSPRTDEYFKITVQGDTFRVDLAARAYAYVQTSDRDYINSMRSNSPIGSPVQMSLYFVRNSDGTLKIRSFTSNSTDTNLRNGCVLTQGGTPITLGDCGIYEVISLENLVPTTSPIDYLVALSPVSIEESADSVICKSAKLQYMVQGTFAQAPVLESQIFALRVNGVKVAERSSNSSSITFAKSSIPMSGNVTCMQMARQGDASITLESAISSKTDAASISKAKLIAEAKKKYFETLEVLGNLKSEALRKYSADNASIDYQAEVEKWKKAILDAQNVRDAEIAAASLAETKNLASSGAQIKFTK